jgi:hypothetical protein
LDSKVEPFCAPHAKAKTEHTTMNNVEPIQDPMTLLAQRLDQMTIEILHTQSLLMNKVTNLERVQQQSLPPRPQYNNNRQQRGNQGWKPRLPNEQRFSNTLAHIDMINQEVVPW